MSTTSREIYLTEPPARPGVTQRELRGIGRRLIERSECVEADLSAQLERIRRRHELDWRTLLASHREMAERGVLAPSAAEFWSATASPATVPLVRAACNAIDTGVATYADALRRFETSLQQALDRGVEAGTGELTAILEDLEAAVADSRALLEGCYLDRGPLDRLGARWQARLRRAAQRSLLPHSLFVPVREAEAVVGAAELELLDRSPWIHDDRLLTAFELAHADVRMHLREQLGRLSVVVPRRALHQ